VNIQTYLKKVYLTDNAIATTALLGGIWGLSYIGQKKAIDMFKNRKRQKYEDLGNINNCNTLEDNSSIYKCKKYFLNQEHNLNTINIYAHIKMLKDSTNVDKKTNNYNKEKYDYELTRLEDKVKESKSLYNHRVALLKLQYLS
jgi:hypothetical protein